MSTAAEGSASHGAAAGGVHSEVDRGGGYEGVGGHEGVGAGASCRLGCGEMRRFWCWTR